MISAQLFSDTLRTIHKKHICKYEIEAFNRLFLQSYKPSDTYTAHQFLSRTGGSLFKNASNFRGFPENDWSLQNISDGTTHKLYSTNKFVFKTYTDNARVLSDEDLIKEIIYGGFLTYMEPRLFEGVIKYDFVYQTKIINNGGLVDCFNYYSLGLPMPVRFQLAKNITIGLQRMHQLDFIHNDIKLENILVNRSNYTIKFIDFEKVELINSSVDFNTMSGTYEYCTPLLYLSGDNVMKRSKWTDLYALSSSILILLYDFLPSSSSTEFIGLLNEHERRNKCVRDYKDIHPGLHGYMNDITGLNIKYLERKYRTPENFILEFACALFNLDTIYKYPQ